MALYEEEIKRLERSSRWATVATAIAIIIVAASIFFAASRLLTLEGKTVDLTEEAARAYDEVARTRLAVGDTMGASEAYVKKALLYYEQGNYTAAISELEKARTVDPLNRDVVPLMERTKRACAAENRLGAQNRCE